MKFLNWLFKPKIKSETKSETKSNSDFTIEYYPITDRYYPKYKDTYMQKDFFTGIINLKEDYLFAYSSNFKTEEEARKLIELFKEQHLKENVKTINL